MSAPTPQELLEDFANRLCEQYHVDFVDLLREVADANERTETTHTLKCIFSVDPLEELPTIGELIDILNVELREVGNIDDRGLAIRFSVPH